MIGVRKQAKLFVPCFGSLCADRVFAEGVRGERHGKVKRGRGGGGERGGNLGAY